jgi:hypothetical protein
MYSISERVLAFILSFPQVVDTFGDRIWTSENPPKGYEPSLGLGVTLQSRGGSDLDQVGAAVEASFYGTIYGPTDDDITAGYLALLGAIRDKKSSYVRKCCLESDGTLTIDPQTDWSMMIFVLDMIVVRI